LSDIIVTFPRGGDPTVKMDRYTTYWCCGRWPKETEPGEHIYFTYRGEVRYVAKISDIQRGVEKGEIDFERMKELPKPWEKMEGFRGYRYYPNNKEETRK